MAALIEFEVAGARYRAERLNAFKQFAVVRRLGKVAGAFAGAAQQFRSGGIGDPLMLLEPFLNALGDMKDEDVDFILSTCLGQVQREQNGAWAKLMSGGRFMFQDVDDMAIMGRIVWHVLQGSLADFFTELLSALPDLGTETGSTGSASPEAKTG
jgi:hypothetical protein